MVYYSRLIEEGWRIYASVNFAIIGSDNGLSPVWQKKIIWTIYYQLDPKEHISMEFYL